jgi:hypothetical protein
VGEIRAYECRASIYSVVGIEDEIHVIGGLVPMVGITKIVGKYSIHEDMWARIKDLAT